MNLLSRFPNEYSQSRLLRLCSDSRNAVRLHARRLVMRYGSNENQLELLRSLSGMPTAERIQLIQDLPIRSSVIPVYLASAWKSSEPGTVIPSLDLVISLQRYFELPCPSQFANHPNLELRIRFFRTLPFLSTPTQAVPIVQKGIRDDDWRVRAMAARAAGLLRLVQLGPDLVQLCITATQAAEAGHAARALAAMGGDSWDHLRRVANQGAIAARQVADVSQKSSLWGATGLRR
jgi:HEAT repeat protein